MTARQIVDLLNDASALDPEGLEKLLIHWFPINAELSDHPTIPCWGAEEMLDGIPRLSPLGLLNGITALDGVRIGMVVDPAVPVPRPRFYVIPHDRVGELDKLGIGLLPPKKEDLKRLIDKQKNQVTVPQARRPKPLPSEPLPAIRPAVPNCRGTTLNQQVTQ